MFLGNTLILLHSTQKMVKPKFSFHLLKISIVANNLQFATVEQGTSFKNYRFIQYIHYLKIFYYFKVLL